MEPNEEKPSGQVEPVEVHDLVPRRDEVADELLLRVVTRVDLGKGPQLGVGAEDEVDPTAGPGELRRSQSPWPSKTSASAAVGVHVVPMSSRFTKKSLVSRPGREVSTPTGDCASWRPAPADRRPGRSSRARSGRAGWPGRPAGTPRAAGAPCRRSCGNRRPSARARRRTRRRSAPATRRYAPG